MSSIKKSHIIILTVLVSFLILAVYFKYIRKIQIDKYNDLILKAKKINTEINTNLSVYYKKLSTISDIITLKKKILMEKEIISHIKTHIQNKPEISSMIKDIMLSNGVQIEEFSFSGFDVNKKKYRTRYKVKITGNIKNILKLMEDIEYEVDWLILDNYNLSFIKNQLAEMSFTLTAYGRIE